MFYMKNTGGNAFKRVRSAEKREELLKNGWTDVESPVEEEADETEPDAPASNDPDDSEKEDEPSSPVPELDVESPVEVKSTYQRRTSRKPKGKTVTV